MRIHSVAAGALLVCCLAGAPAAAQRPVQTHSLRWDPALDLTVTVGGAATWSISEIWLTDVVAGRSSARGSASRCRTSFIPQSATAVPCLWRVPRARASCHWGHGSPCCADGTSWGHRRRRAGAAWRVSRIDARFDADCTRILRLIHASQRRVCLPLEAFWLPDGHRARCR
jgi:hypothetical protein